MSRQKLKDKFMPLDIIELNAYEIVFNRITNHIINSKEIEYKSSAPMSMDMLKIIDLCSDENNSEMYRFAPASYDKNGNKAALEKTDAIINVSFSEPNVKLLNKLNVPEMKFGDFTFPKGLRKQSKEALFGLYLAFYNAYAEYNDFFNTKGKSGDKSQELEVPGWNKFKAYKESDKENIKLSPEEVAMKTASKKVKKEIEKAKEESEITKADKKRIFEEYFEDAYRKAYIGTIINRTVSKLKKLVDYYVTRTECIKAADIPDKNKSKSRNVKLRILLYTEGVDVTFDDKTVTHYVNYKRSASKAKKGNVIFIAEELYEPMKNWTWLGLPYQNLTDCDLTSMKAYESLVMSSVINTVEIENPQESILMLESVESDVITGNRKIMVKEEDELILLTDEEYKKKYNKDFVHRNVIWDGMALVDESVFKSAGYEKTEKGDNSQGMMLLRNSFFKACAFNTNITKYYKDNNVTTVTDMFGRELKAKNIKMIVTIDSLKLDKFAEDFFGQGKSLNPDNEDAHKKLYEHWLKNIDVTFGIVKEEHESHIAHGKMHEVSYQMLNTLPLTYEDMKELVKDDIDYIKLMRSNPEVMAERLKNTSSSARKRFFVSNMLTYAPDFANTSKYYTKFLCDEVDDYKDKLKRGRLKIRSDFYVLCSMPMEMLEYSVHRNWDEIKPYLEKDEAYIDSKEIPDDITLMRYPHMNAGSFCTLKQNKNKEYQDKIQ